MGSTRTRPEKYSDKKHFAQTWTFALRMGGVGSEKESVLRPELIHHEVPLFALIKINFPCSWHQRAGTRCDFSSCAVGALTKQLEFGFARNCSTSLSGLLPRPIGSMRGASWHKLRAATPH
jgi:hypothetical protein